MKRILPITILTILWLAPAQAQLYNDGLITNNGGVISDWQNQWFNTNNGVYNGANNGIFEHHGASSQTFINNGTYNATTGHSDQFLGPLGVNGTQEIGGTTRPFFFNLILNNGAANEINITNTDGANIRNTATFSNGITTTIRGNHQGSALRFEDGAGYSGGNSDAQHVNGYVSKIGDDGFIFPVGSGTDIRTVTINAASVPSELSVAWFAGDPSSVTDPSDAATHPLTAVAAPIVSVSPVGFWDWILVSGNDDNQAVTVSIPNMSTFASTAMLRLLGWNGTAWIDLSGGPTASGNTENSTLSGTIPAGVNITALAIGSITFVLPLQWQSFTVTTKPNCVVQLDWSTSWEEHTAYYEIQQSADGVNFNSIARIAAAGHSNQTRHYQAYDRNALYGSNYYRIRQVDIDGRSSYSETRRIDPGCRSRQTVLVYPTVTNNTVTIQLPQGQERSSIRLINTKGQIIAVPVEGSGLYRYITMHALASGVYIVQIIDERSKKISNHKVIRQ